MALGHKFNISSVQVVGTPTPVNRTNQFDELGNLISLSRFIGESNSDYKRRLSDTFVHIANSSYRGLIHGITRELGLTLFDAITINPRVNSSGGFLAPDPKVIFDGVYLLLYSDYYNDRLDWAIDRYQPGGNYEHLNRLVDRINATTLFEASIEPGISPFTRSATILNQSSRILASSEVISISDRLALGNQHVVEGTLIFSDLETYRSEVASVNDIVSSGQYYVDYRWGIITSFSAPEEGTRVRYEYTKYPFKALASPVILNDINNDNFRIKLFEQVLQDNGEYVNGLPVELGVDIVNELLSCYPSYWSS